MWLGDFPEDFTTVTCMFTTHDGNGAPVAPLTAFEAADVIIYKNGSATQKTSTNGVTMTSPFDSITGLHCLVIDTSNDTGDSGFWTTGGGGVYTLVLSPDTETVNGQAVAKVIGQFGIALAPALRPTVAGRTLDVSATGEAGVDWANVGSPTTTLALTGTTIAVTQKVDVDTIKTNPVVNLGTITFPTTATLASTTNITAGTITTVGTLTTYTGNTPQTGDSFARIGATGSGLTSITNKTDNLPSDPADESLIIAATDAIIAAVAAVQADLPQKITKNVALAAFPFFMADSTDHVSGKTGLTVTAERSLDGAAFGACANAAAEIGNGWYKISLAAGDLNANTVALKFTATGADATNTSIITQPT